ncbi:hypothetical protein BN59_01672 [Legionella massiliensis]|uniref:Uncharacterized protein n=1 Tax=Legionella massiliensis TaxID=1034943 RepID=A0A078L010_9GAMM|nr:hypothetical protein [Legionella massiliensis]CDZ77389.1 hypothetical protein BN59_01672 [Legionella massiliensis]CEE13127.1 hypothetical protein BN1094_01672 [Legionella massiliensis]
MKIAFLVSSNGDAELAYKTIKVIETKPEHHEVVLIALSKVIQKSVDSFQSPLVVEKKALAEILQLDSESCPELHCESEQIQSIVHYIKGQDIAQAYIGVPSVSKNQIPLQVAECLNEIPVLMAYEFMFKPEGHELWEYLPALTTKSNLQWALPLDTAREDFSPELKAGIIGHLSIDNAYATQAPSLEKLDATRGLLKIGVAQQLAFLSATTQDLAVDTGFLDCLLTELPNHPGMQLRLGLHPGTKDYIDAYVKAILDVYANHLNAALQFKIILPDNLVEHFKSPDLTINNPAYQSVFQRVNVSGAEAAAAANRIAQAVPGALLNQAALEGKPAYSHLGKPYLPEQYFANSIATFFTASPKEPPKRVDLGLNEQSAAENCAAFLLK